MREDIKDRWVARLRSGQDEQGRGWLNKDGKKCCLGVLCEIAVEDGVIGSAVQPTVVDDRDRIVRVVYGLELDVPTSPSVSMPYRAVATFADYNLRCDQVLPKPVRSWAQVRTTTAFLTGGLSGFSHTEPTDLASANDRFEYTFNQIADLIEQHWETI